MINQHLHILHLFADTLDEKTNRVAEYRYKKLIRELSNQGLSENDYTLVPGFYDPKNTKQAIHKGHRAIVQSAKDIGAEMVIVAEDDIVWTNKGAWKYFLSQIPKSFDLFFGLIYAGSIDNNNRVLNGFSGGMSLYVCHNRFYDTFLEQPIDTHIDRQLGNFCYKYEFYLCNPQVVTQRGGISFNLGGRSMFYWPYMEGKQFYGRENQKCVEGIWQVE